MNSFPSPPNPCGGSVRTEINNFNSNSQHLRRNWAPLFNLAPLRLSLTLDVPVLENICMAFHTPADIWELVANNTLKNN